MIDKLDSPALDRLFREARTRNAWPERPLTERQLRELYDLMKLLRIMQQIQLHLLRRLRIE